MTNDQVNKLVDIALQLKQQIENRDIEKLKMLFDPNAKINIYGRFYDLKAFMDNLPKILSAIEQPGLDIISVDESEIGADSGFVAFTAEIFWINQKSWEEVSQMVSISLELKRDLKKKESWFIKGFTLAQVKKVVEKEEVPIFSKTDDQKGNSGSFLDGFFNFWY